MSHDVKLINEAYQKTQHMLFYHGTSSKNLASIKKHGLVPGKSQGADYWALGPDEEDEYNVFPPAKIVSLADNIDDAKGYANVSTEVNGGTPVIFIVRIPRSHFGNLHGVNKKGFHPSYTGIIPPEWIFFK